MKSAIRFTSTQKPDGDEYKKVTYWNRFVRTKNETLILLALIIASIGIAVYRLTTGTMDTMWAIITVIFLLYPVMVIMQFNSSIRYHLKHRNPAEIEPCEFTIMENGILIDVPSCDVRVFHKYDEFTHLYTNVFGYVMLFQKNKVLAMLKHSDIPAEQLDDALNLILDGIEPTCKIKKFF